MDNSKGFFEKINEETFEKQMQQENPQVFKVGEIIEVRGSRLRVEKIYKKKITFKLLPILKQNEDLKEILMNHNDK